MTIKNIQGLRAIAALLVVGVHFGNINGFEHRYLGNPHPFTEILSRFGYFGVDLFFIISGFIMVVTTFREDGRSLTALEFFKRRCIRIYPPLWIINTIVLAVFLVKPSLVNSHGGAPTNILASYLLLPQAGNALVLVSWTLVYEMFFYVVFTLGLIGGKRSLIPVLLTWAAGIVIANFINPVPQNIYIAFLQNQIVCEFLLGMAIAFLSRRSLPKQTAVVATVSGILAMFMLALPIANGTIDFPDGWLRVAAALPLAAILLGAVLFERKVGSIAPKPLQTLGDASYSLYLWHIPVLTFAGIVLHMLHPHGRIPQFGGLLVGLTAVIGASLLVYRYIELPVTEWTRSCFSRKSLPVAEPISGKAWNPTVRGASPAPSAAISYENDRQAD